MNVLAYACGCVGAHHDDCALLHRLIIKDRLCRRLKVASSIAPRIADAIDRLVARRFRARGIEA